MDNLNLKQICFDLIDTFIFAGKKSLELRNAGLKTEYKEQFRYDLVIKVRPDYFIQSYDVEDFKNVNDNTLYMSKNYKESVIEEQFVFGNSKTMDKYASVFLQQAGMFNEKIWGDAEYIHYLGLTKFHNINIKHLNYKVGFLYSETKNHMR